MTDKIIVYNLSRKMHVDITLGTICELQGIRKKDIEMDVSRNTNYTQMIVNASRLPKEPSAQNRAVDVRKVYSILKESANPRTVDNGRVILLDDELASPRDLFTGGVHGVWLHNGGLGYVFASTFNQKDETSFRNLVRHELGHMFGAKDHCFTLGCVMQVDDFLSRNQTYCSDCKSDIKNYDWRAA